MKITSVNLIPDSEQLEQSLQLQRTYGTAFEYNDFISPSMLDNRAAVEERISQYQGLNRDCSRDTLHGVIYDILVHSLDPMVREVANHRIRQSMDIAAALGVRGVIFHTNLRGDFTEPMYQQGYLAANEQYWKQLLSDYPKLCVYLENVFDASPDMLCRLAERMKTEPRFGVCFDIGHAFLTKSAQAEWLDGILPYTKHLHLNDNMGQSDEHLALGEGRIDWNLFVSKMQSHPGDATALLEVKGYERQLESLRFCESRFKTLLL